MRSMMQEFKRGQRAATNSRNRKKGSKAEDIVAHALEAAGYLCIEPIETGWTIIRKYDPVKKQSVIVSAFPKKKVSGDIKAIEPGTGRAVHVEVKARPDNLVYSALEDHQVKALDRVVAAGGVGILAWVRGLECRLYRWPVAGFGPGKSLKWPTSAEQADKIKKQYPTMG